MGELGRAAGVRASEEDLRTVRAVLDGDGATFASLVDRHGPAMLRLAAAHTPTRAVAEDVVQETWLAVLEGLPRFEGRSSLKTWIYRILLNRAITAGQRERRTLPFSSVASFDGDEDEPSVDPDRFQGPADPLPGAWAQPPVSWDELPEGRLLSNEALGAIRAAIDALPPNQRTVISLRDVSGWTSQEVCNLLGLTETNQRVLLHRARAKVRSALGRYLGTEPDDEGVTTR